MYIYMYIYIYGTELVDVVEAAEGREEDGQVTVPIDRPPLLLQIVLQAARERVLN